MVPRRFDNPLAAEAWQEANRCTERTKPPFGGIFNNYWSDWLRLLESVKSGEPLDKDEPEEPDYRRRFTWAMHHRTLETAPIIAAQLPLKGVNTLLDLGGGPGTYAMAFLAKHPRLRATVCDRPAALEVAKDIAATGRVALVLDTRER